MDEYGVSAAELRACSLDSFADGVFGPLENTISMPWLMRLGQGKSACCYCPLCLSEGREAYFRLIWRLAFVTHCPAHGVLLQQGCPACGDPVWPASGKYMARQPGLWSDIDSCPRCRNAYSVAPATFVGNPDTVRRHLELARAASSDSTLAGGSSQAYFAGLRAICQMLVRKGNEKLAPHMPLPQPVTEAGQYIEYFPSATRAMLIEAAAWLTDDWPHRFIMTCQSARMSKGAFHGMTSKLPEWVRAVVEQNLSKANRVLSDVEISTTVEHLRQKGRKPTKQAILRELGVTVSQTLNRKQSLRRRATREECLEVLAQFMKMAATAPTVRHERNTMTRDCLIFLVSMLSGKTAKQVCTLSETEARRTIAQADWSLSDMKRLRTQIDVLCRTYENAAAEWCDSNPIDAAAPWFISRSGKPFSAHTVRSRVSKLAQNCTHPSLWNSVNAFVGALQRDHDPLS
ncbi:MAG: hypothetical protein JWL63_1513 [Rhodocyclales bacterium]|nr:hypothetical protein [Rhodocyclales bacterium]